MATLGHQGGSQSWPHGHPGAESPLGRRWASLSGHLTLSQTEASWMSTRGHLHT